MITRKYPKLFKSLAGKFGARKARKLLALIHKEMVAKGEQSHYDTPILSASILFSDTSQGFGYWARVNRKFSKTYGSSKKWVR
jgi:hypothetical protein